MSKILEIRNLSKQYGNITALNTLNLSIEKGSIFGLLGPNGSGKTTTLGIVLGITKADSGSYEWFEGQHGQDNNRHLGVLLETPNFYPYLDAVRNLEIVAHIKKIKDTNFDDILELVNLKHRKTSPFRTYSLGMKQRLAIAAAMVGDPDVLIFDEPTNGLDPVGIAEVRETIMSIAKRGKTIIMASHILDEVEKVCTHVAIIKNGNLLANGLVGSILSDAPTIELDADNPEALYKLLENSQMVKNLHRQNGKIMLQLTDNHNTAELNKLAFDNGIVLTHLISKKKRLEEEFLQIIK